MRNQILHALFAALLAAGAAAADPDAASPAPAPAAPTTNVIVPASADAAPAAPPQAPVVGLDDTNVQRVHVVEKRPFTEAGRSELTLFGVFQMNPKFTVHGGASAELAYHLRENLAAQIGAHWFPLAVESALTDELVTKVHQQPLAANALLLQGDALAGLELMPVYGKLNIFDGKILRLGFYLNAGLGAGKTRLQLRPANSDRGRSFGDTGFRPMAGLGAGFRVFLSEQFTVRLELRDLVYSAYVSKVNGCSYQDTRNIATNGSASNALSSGCSANAFGDSEADIKNNGAIAADQLKDPSADVINNVAFEGGLSWLF